MVVPWLGTFLCKLETALRELIFCWVEHFNRVRSRDSGVGTDAGAGVADITDSGVGTDAGAGVDDGSDSGDGSDAGAGADDGTDSGDGADSGDGIGFAFVGLLHFGYRLLIYRD